MTEPRSFPQTALQRTPGSVELLIVRHGSSAAHVEGEEFPLVGGHGDPPLAPEGLTQAERLGARLAGEPIDAVYVSTLQRTVQTAAPLAARRGSRRRSSPTSARCTSASGRPASSARRWPTVTRWRSRCSPSSAGT